MNMYIHIYPHTHTYTHSLSLSLSIATLPIPPTQAVNPAPGVTLHRMMQMQPSLAMRTKMLPVYDRAALDVFDRLQHTATNCNTSL